MFDSLLEIFDSLKSRSTCLLLGHEASSPNGSDNGMGDYEDDIPAGGSAFGSGGTPATALTQSNSSVSRGDHVESFTVWFFTTAKKEDLIIRLPDDLESSSWFLKVFHVFFVWSRVEWGKVGQQGKVGHFTKHRFYKKVK